MTLQFTIPGRPSAWQRHIEFVDKRTGWIVKKTPGDMKAQQQSIQLLCRAAMRTTPPITGPVKLEVLAVYAVPPSWPKWKQEAAATGTMWKTSVPDHDNLVKQVSDALNGVAYVDDAQIAQTSFGKRYGHPERTEVRLTAMNALSDHSPRGHAQEVLDRARGQDSLDLSPSKPRSTLNRGAA